MQQHFTVRSYIDYCVCVCVCVFVLVSDCSSKLKKRHNVIKSVTGITSLNIL